MNNKLIYVQWSNDFGGLEKVTQIYENKFSHLNPLIVPLRYVEGGLHYNNVYRLKNRDKFFFIVEYLRFVSARRSCIFHIQYAGSFILLITFLAGGRKIIFHFHGTKFSANLFDRLVWKFLGDKIKVIANSNQTKKVIEEKLYSKKNIFIIPNLISTSNFLYKKRECSNKFVVTYAGRFTKGKNLVLFLEAIKKLETAGKINDFEFRLYGDGVYKKNIMDKIDELGLSKIINVFPFEKDINKVYQESSLFIFLSLYESFGNVAAEAILTGLPLICYRIPSLEEFINDDKFFIDELNPELLADKIIDFKENYSEITKRMESVYKFTSNYLDNERIANQLNQIYKDLLN